MLVPPIATSETISNKQTPDPSPAGPGQVVQVNSLFDEFFELFGSLEKHFAQGRSFQNARDMAAGLLCGVGTRTITRAISCLQRDQQDWSAFYKFFSRSPWDPAALFEPIYEQAIPEYCPRDHVAIAVDDTGLPRVGKKVPGTNWQRDPMSPPFHPNLRWGHRFLQASLLLPLYQKDPEASARALPISFGEANVPRKPGKKASPEEKDACKEAREKCKLSRRFVELGKELRQTLDGHGFRDKKMIIAADGSFCNKTTFKDLPERTALLARCRKDIKVRKAAPAALVPSGSASSQDLSPSIAPGDPQGAAAFTPEEVLRDEQIPWQHATVYYGGKLIAIQYKSLTAQWECLGKKSAPLRLITVKALPYKKSPNGEVNRHKPAYLLCTDLEMAASELIQIYFDRWEIEVNHRDEKQILGVGQAQVWNEKSVVKVPEFMVASYSLMLLASLKAHGYKREDGKYLPLPKWRKHARRASCLDMVRLMRKELNQRALKGEEKAPQGDYTSMIESAAA